MPDAIETVALTKSFGPVTAVKNLNLTIPAGSVFGFLGPNGAGKTTTIRMLLGLVRQSSGRARVLGHDTVDEREKVSSLVGAIVEVPAFYPYLSGADNLRALALGTGHRLAPERLTSLLTRVGLSSSATRPTKAYSLGMKQRLGIAAALIADPPVLFLDEPTNGLDPEGAREIRDLLAALRSSGRTIFLSSHLLGEVERICTDVAILRNGEVRLQGNVGELLAHRGFEIRLSSVARAKALLRLAAPGPADGAGWISVAETDATISSVLRRLLGEGIDVYEVKERRNTLEALFFETTGQEQPGEERA